MKDNLKKIINERFANKHCVYPLDMKEDRLIVQMSNFEPQVIELLQQISNKEIIVRQVEEDVIRENIRSNYSENTSDNGQDIVDEIIVDAIDKGVSDIHIEPFKSQLRIRFRHEGDLKVIKILSIEDYPIINSVLKLRAGCSITEKRLPQDGRFTFEKRKNVDIRLSTIPTMHGEKTVLRLLDKNKFLRDRVELGFTEFANRKIDKLLAKKSGIILISGITGSGKSSTVYSIINELNRKNLNIMTIEDPIEVDVEGVNQIQVNSKIGITFETGLRSILRQDPDCIIVGEIRDAETARTAIRAAITGHLVIASIHTVDSISTIFRLTDMGIENYLVSASLIGVIAQKLVKKNSINFNDDSDKRTLIYEILEVNEDLKRGIHKGLNSSELRKIGERNGMISFEDSILSKKNKI